MEFDPGFRDDLLTSELWQQAMLPLRLPAAGRYGSLQVVRQATQALPLFGQQLLFPTPIVCTLLYENGTLWMSDTPQERLMMLRGTTDMQGHILVAGGGLGAYPQFLCRYQAVQRITVVESHPDVVALLRSTLAALPVEIVQTPFEVYIEQAGRQTFDGCYIDIHPTIDPRWLPKLNWLRNRCAAFVSGPVRIWGYHWMVRELVRGLEHAYLPRLRMGLPVADPLCQDLARALPCGWQTWTKTRLRAWLVAYAHSVAWPCELQPQNGLQGENEPCE